MSDNGMWGPALRHELFCYGNGGVQVEPIEGFRLWEGAAGSQRVFARDLFPGDYVVGSSPYTTGSPIRQYRVAGVHERSDGVDVTLRIGEGRRPRDNYRLDLKHLSPTDPIWVFRTPTKERKK